MILDFFLWFYNQKIKIKRVSFFTKLFVILGLINSIYAQNIGLVIMATGKYLTFAQEMIDSAEKFFLINHKKTYFIFTDQKSEVSEIIMPKGNSIVYIPQARLGWPYDTMMRASVYLKNFKYLHGCDFLFAIDADMKFVANIDDKILSERVAVLHPGFPPKKRGSYETRKSSTAYVANDEGVYYFAGGFHGGSKKEFLKLCSDLTKNINTDLEHNLIAIWHDESHLNRWFIDNTPTSILDVSYCYPENARTMDPSIWPYLSKFQPKLLALAKNHAEVRK